MSKVYRRTQETFRRLMANSSIGSMPDPIGVCGRCGHGGMDHEDSEGRAVHCSAYIGKAFCACPGFVAKEFALPEIETGPCACGQSAVLTQVDGEYVFLCDECREYYRGQFNVEVPVHG